MPVVGPEPPVVIGEVAGSVSERELLSAVYEGRAALTDPVSQHMEAPLPLLGSGRKHNASQQQRKTKQLKHSKALAKQPQCQQGRANWLTKNRDRNKGRRKIAQRPVKGCVP